MRDNIEVETLFNFKIITTDDYENIKSRLQSKQRMQSKYPYVYNDPFLLFQHLHQHLSDLLLSEVLVWWNAIPSNLPSLNLPLKLKFGWNSSPNNAWTKNFLLIRKARSAVSVIYPRVQSVRASLPSLPRRFYTRPRPFVRILPALLGFGKNTTVLQSRILARFCI